MNWNLLSKNIKTREEFNEWERLKKYFGPLKFNYFDLIVYHIRRCHPYNTLRYTLTNRIVRPTGIVIPPQYATCIRRPYKYPNLDKFLELLKTINISHSIYAFCAALFLYNKADLMEIKASARAAWYSNAPVWLQIILDRQRRLCRNAFLKDTDPFFFVKEDNEIRRVGDRHLTNISKLLESAIGITLKDYIFYYHKFAGMKSNGIILEGSNSDVYTELKQRRRRNLYSAVKILQFTPKGRINYLCGFCLGEPEPGIYLVDTKIGKLIVPFYLLDIPVINIKHPPVGDFKELLSLGYIPEKDWPLITNLDKLINYKIKIHD